MQRTGRNANIARRPSNDLNSACLNFTELQRGHTRRIHSGCGSQSGQFRPESLMSISFPYLSPHLLECPALCLTSIRVQPGEKTSDAARGQCDAGIGCTVIQVDRVSVSSDGLSAREDDIVHIAVPFIRSLWPEYP